MAELTITKNNFETEVLQSSIPVVVDFWADWCGPCKMFAPVLAEFAAAHEGEVKVGKVNVDEEAELAGQFGVMSIPTVILFEGGQVKSTMVGVQPREKLEELL